MLSSQEGVELESSSDTLTNITDDISMLFERADSNASHGDRVIEETCIPFNTESLKSFSDFLETLSVDGDRESALMNLMSRVFSIGDDMTDHKRDYSAFTKSRRSLAARWMGSNISKVSTNKHLICPKSGALVLRRNVLLACPSGAIDHFLRVTAVYTKQGNKYYLVESLSLSQTTSNVFVVHATRVKYTNNDETIRRKP